MQLKNTTSFDMARFLLMLDEMHTEDLQHLFKFHKLWPVLYHTIYMHEKHAKENKINQLRFKRQKLTIKIIKTKQSDAAEDEKNRKITQMQSYIRNINKELYKLSR